MMRMTDQLLCTGTGSKEEHSRQGKITTFTHYWQRLNYSRAANTHWRLLYRPHGVWVEGWMQ